MDFIKKNYILILIFLLALGLRLNYDIFINGYNYDEIADFIVNLKTIDVVQDAYVPTIDYVMDEETGVLHYEFPVECVYVDPNAATETEVDENGLGE